MKSNREAIPRFSYENEWAHYGVVMPTATTFSEMHDCFKKTFRRSKSKYSIQNGHLILAPPKSLLDVLRPLCDPAASTIWGATIRGMENDLFDTGPGAELANLYRSSTGQSIPTDILAICSLSRTLLSAWSSIKHINVLSKMLHWHVNELDFESTESFGPAIYLGSIFFDDYWVIPEESFGGKYGRCWIGSGEYDSMWPVGPGIEDGVLMNVLESMAEVHLHINWNFQLPGRSVDAPIRFLDEPNRLRPQKRAECEEFCASIVNLMTVWICRAWYRRNERQIRNARRRRDKWPRSTPVSMSSPGGCALLPTRGDGEHEDVSLKKVTKSRIRNAKAQLAQGKHEMPISVGLACLDAYYDSLEGEQSNELALAGARDLLAPAYRAAGWDWHARAFESEIRAQQFLT